MAIQIIPLATSASHIYDNISGGLYKDPIACLLETIRNGLCASMPGTDWVPGVGNIALELTRHPLAEGRVLTVLDRGHGFNQRSLKLMSSLGRTIDEKTKNPKGDFGGAAQKGIGRYAPFGCMKRGKSKDFDPTRGFYILTRAKKSGPITLISMVPSLIELHNGTPIEELSLDDVRLGDVASFTGTFSMVIIPDPVFVDADDIIEGVQWRLPRKKSQMFTLTVNGEKVVSPPLAARVNFISEDKTVEVRVDVEQEPSSDTGLWLTDAGTGFRVAFAPHLGRAFVPPPYNLNGFRGDIFVKGLLPEQNASRGGLNSDFLRSDAWKKVQAILFANRSTVEALLGNQRTREGKGEQEITDLMTLALKAFGSPEVGIDQFGSLTRKKSPNSDRQNAEDGSPRKSSGSAHKERTGDSSDPAKSGTSTRNKQREVRSIRLGTHDFLIDVQRLLPLQYAAADIRIGDEPVTIYLNDAYTGLPTRAEMRSEHVITAFLFAAACADPDCANNAQQAMEQVMKWREKLFC